MLLMFTMTVLGISVSISIYICFYFSIYFYFYFYIYISGLVSSGDILTSWGEGAYLALVGYPSSDSVTMKMPYGVDVLHRPASHPIFSYWVG